MKTFNVLIYRQGRALISIMIFISLFIPILFLTTHIENSFVKWSLTLFCLIGLILLLRYYTVGRLFVTVDNSKILFKWNKKVLFKYKEIPTIDISEIKSIVLDNEGKILRKIITKKIEIELGHGYPNNYLKSDSQKFIQFLTSEINDLEIKDSWDVWVEKGLLKWALRINTIILVLGILIVGLYIVLKGYDSRQLLLLIFILPQLILYQIQMNTKINKN
jgi:hypothetical protein